MFSCSEDSPQQDNACVDEGEDICGCMEIDAINYDPLATLDDGTCQYYTGELNVIWSKSYTEIGGEMWSIRPVSDGGFIMHICNAGDCVGYGCEYY